MPSTVQGAVVALLAADETIQLLVPSGVFAGDEPEEKTLPFLLVQDAEDKQHWVCTTSRLETHRLTVRAWAAAARTPGAANPAEAIMGRVEQLLNWDDLALPDTVPVRFEQKKHSLSLEGRRAPDKARVCRAERVWEVVFEQRLPGV
jgi:hypothetical protein